MKEQPALIRAIENIVEGPLYPAFGVGYDPALAVMPNLISRKNRYVLNKDGALIGLNLAYALVLLPAPDEKWKQILELPDFKPELLEALNLRGNYLKESPVTKTMTRLRYLDLSENAINEFEAPQPLALEHILLSDNMMDSPPLEIVKQGNKALLNYLKEVERERPRPLWEAKMLLLGEPGAGKTTLARKLQDIYAPLPGKEESTKGIAIETLQIGTGEDVFTARIWDFGGQHIYQGTHRFFLTKRSLWVIVADNRRQDTDFNYWLQMAELYGEDSPLFIVINQSDNRAPYQNTKGMRERFHFLKTLLAANFDTRGETAGENEVEARQRNTEDTQRIAKVLKAEIQQLPHVDTVWPSSWLRVRRRLEKLVEKEGLDYISLPEFYRVCEENDLKDRESQMVLSSYLHDLGVILHFKEDPVLRETVILSMGWATQAVFAVYDNLALNSNERPGCFNKSDLATIWGAVHFRDKQDQLLALMLRFKLCYQVKDSELYIMPELLPANQPDFAALIPALNQDKLDKAPTIRYTYDFMPKGIFTRFAVEVHKHIALNQQLIWREGAVLQKGDSYALVTETYGNKEINIKTTGRHKRELMDIATHYLDDIHGSFSKLKVSKLVPCNCTVCTTRPMPHYYNFEALENRIKHGKTIVECDISLEEVEMKALLYSLFPTEEERRQQPMDRMMEPEPEKDDCVKIFISYSKSDIDYLNALNKHLSPLLRSKKAVVWTDNNLIPGVPWDAEIKRQLHEADIVLFLASPDFFGTDYIWDQELTPIIEKNRQNLVTAIPIILRPCDWTSTELTHLGALPHKAKPVSSYANPDDAYLEIVKGIRTVIEARETSR